MSLSAVSLTEVKEYLRITHNDEDATLTLLIAAANEAALHVAQNHDPEAEPPASLKLAILVHVCRAYVDRSDAADLPPSAARLLSPLRKLDV